MRDLTVREKRKKVAGILLLIVNNIQPQVYLFSVESFVL